LQLQGNPAPGGGNWSSFTDPVLNGAGQVMFRANLTGGSSASGLFVGAPGAVQAAALQGAPAPAGGDYGGFDNAALNGAGKVAFLANLTGTGVTAANDRGLYAGSVGGLVKVIREGDQVDVDPGPGVDLRTIADGGISFSPGSDGQDGRSMSFTDGDFITYRLGFSDGSSGIFVSSLTPVPEPTAIGLMAAAGLMSLRALCRRRWSATGTTS
jgi:hypothetical protein